MSRHTRESLMRVADDKDCTWHEQGANWLGTHKTEIHHLMYILFFSSYEFRKTQNINNSQTKDARYIDKGNYKMIQNDVNITCCTFCHVVLTKPFWKIYNMVIFDKVNLFEVWDNKIRLQVVNSKGRILCILHKNHS